MVRPFAPGERLVMSTDAHVVSPLLFFPGDIGCLAVHGFDKRCGGDGGAGLHLAASSSPEEGFPLCRARAHCRLDGGRGQPQAGGAGGHRRYQRWSGGQGDGVSTPPPGLVRFQ